MLKYTCRAIINGWTLDNPWDPELVPIISDVLSALEVKNLSGNYSMKWAHLPFSGGLYDQKRVNRLTWDIWQMIAAIWLEELKEFHKGGSNGIRNDNQD